MIITPIICIQQKRHTHTHYSYIKHTSLRARACTHSHAQTYARTRARKHKINIIECTKIFPRGKIDYLHSQFESRNVGN